jgi:hypothetical protein
VSETAITFTPDGIGFALYSEAIPLGRIGRLTVGRATLVEFDNATQLWLVHDRTGFTLFSSPSRQECLEWERRYLEAQEDHKHAELQHGPCTVAAGA